MQQYSYTKSLTLTQQLAQIEDQRKKLLLTPLAPAAELKLQWNAQLPILKNLYALNGTVLSEKEIAQALLTGKSVPPVSRPQVEDFKRVLDHLYHFWLVRKDQIRTDDLGELYRLLTGDFSGFVYSEDLKIGLEYIQINPEHPVVQAALAQMYILALQPFRQHNEELSHIVFLQFLYKSGYDMRRMPVYTNYYLKDILTYKDIVAKSVRALNITSWLEYVASAVIAQLEEVVLEMKRLEISHQADQDPLFDLNERQRVILSFFDQPGRKIANKTVQKKCKVSQITASRDLARLFRLGLIFPVGKGRSTVYTRV